MLDGKTKIYVGIFLSISLFLEEGGRRRKWCWLCSEGSLKWKRTFLTLSLVWPFQEGRGGSMWKREKTRGLAELHRTWFETLPFLSSREIKDKTLYEIFITLIPICLQRATIETLHRWIIPQERAKLKKGLREKGGGGGGMTGRVDEEMEEWGRGGGGSRRRNWREEKGGTSRSVSSEEQIRGNNLHVKAQVLLLLKEVVQDVLPDKVRVEGVVYHLRSAKLDENQERGGGER